MVLCLLALPLFALLGIFSVKYRKLAWDSFHCIFHTITLRKCESGLDDMIKSGISGMLLKYSPWGAKLVYRHYQVFSWIVVALMVWSAYSSYIGVVNYYEYGNCNGPESVGFCMLDPTGQNSAISEVDTLTPLNLTLPKLDDHNPIIGNPNANLTIIEYGCYACPYSKRAEPIIAEVLKDYNGAVNLQFKHFIIPHHEIGITAAIAADCAQEQGMYVEYHNKIFEYQSNLSIVTLKMIALEMGLDTTKFNGCLESNKYDGEISTDNLEGLKAGVSGTPTFFINDKKIVGPKPVRTFKTVIDAELRK